MDTMLTSRLTSSELARRCGVSRSAISQALRRGLLPPLIEGKHDMSHTRLKWYLREHGANTEATPPPPEDPVDVPEIPVGWLQIGFHDNGAFVPVWSTCGDPPEIIVCHRRATIEIGAGHEAAKIMLDDGREFPAVSVQE